MPGATQAIENENFTRIGNKDTCKAHYEFDRTELQLFSNKLISTEF